MDLDERRQFFKILDGIECSTPKTILEGAIYHIDRIGKISKPLKNVMLLADIEFPFAQNVEQFFCLS